jgi:hypothetical protein
MLPILAGASLRREPRLADTVRTLAHAPRRRGASLSRTWARGGLSPTPLTCGRYVPETCPRGSGLVSPVRVSTGDPSAVEVEPGLHVLRLVGEGHAVGSGPCLACARGGRVWSAAVKGAGQDGSTPPSVPGPLPRCLRAKATTEGPAVHATTSATTATRGQGERQATGTYHEGDAHQPRGHVGGRAGPARVPAVLRWRELPVRGLGGSRAGRTQPGSRQR